MICRRTHSQAESEIRWRSGRVWLRRSNRAAGENRSHGCHIQHRSLPCRAQIRQPSDKAVRLAKRLSQEVQGVRLTRLATERVVQADCKSAWRHDMTYLELDDEGLRLSRLVPSDHLEMLETWVNRYLTFRKEPKLRSDSIEVENLILSQEAFGCLLHEAVGHRAEGDDFKLPPVYPEGHSTNFDVWDRVGEREWFGYTPMSDDGVIGRDVRIFNGLLGRGKLLTRKSGNMRASSASVHPLIRSRCLDVVVHSESAPPCVAAIEIDELSLSTFDGENVVLESTIQWLVTKTRRGVIKRRLPRLRISLSPEMITSWSAFGTKELFQPPGGCQKHNQNHLPVSFYAPKGWCSIENLGSIEFLK